MAGDRNPTHFKWIAHFPRLEEVRLVSPPDNANHFRSLVPFTEIKELRVLHLSDVSLRSLKEFPRFPHLEEVRFTNSGIAFPPSTEELEHLNRVLPSIQSFEITQEDADWGKIRYDRKTAKFTFDPPKDDT